MIVSAGSDNAKIMLVGDSASSNDTANGFALSNINTLRQLFNDCGYKIDQCYRTLLIKEELSYNGKAKKKLRLAIQEAMSHQDYQKILFDEIKEVKPNLVVPMGDLSLHALTGFKSVEKYRGSVLPLRVDISQGLNYTIRVIPIFSNRMINEDWSRRVITSFDIQRLLKYKDRTDPIESQNIIWVANTVASFRNWLNRIGNPDFLVFDIETIGGLLSCIGFSVNGIEGVCVPLIDRDIDIGNRTLLWYEVNKLLRSNIPKVNQNIVFDWSILEKYGFVVNNIIGDTMLAAHTLYPELPKNLAFWTSIYTDQPYYKDEGKEFNPQQHEKTQFYSYNAKDAIVTWKIHAEQQKELEEANLSHFHNNRIIPLMKMYKKINDHGILVDTDKREYIIGKYMAFADIKHKTIEAMIGHSINLNAPAQVQALVFDELKFPKKHKTKDDGSLALTTEEDALVDLILFHPYDNTKGEYGKAILEMIRDWRKITKIIQYASIPLHPDNRLRTTYKLYGTNSGRTSGGKSIDFIFYVENGKIKKTLLGGSLQTLPKHGFKIGDQYYGRDIRDMYIAPPGKLLVEGDGSQAEARAVAVLAEDYNLLKLFDIPPGVHKLTAGWIYGVPPTEIQKGTNEYHMGKTVRHAGNNNMREATLSEQTHIDIGEAKKLLEKFHMMSPNIRGVFHKEIREFVRKHRVLISPFSRKRDFFGRLDENLYNEAIGWIQQSTISDQTKFAMYRTSERLPWVEYVYEGHDAGMAEIPEDRLDEYCSVFKEEMEQPINFSNCSLSRDFDLTIPCELEYGTCWGAMKSYGKS